MDPVTGALIGGIANSLFAPKPKYVVPNYQAIRDKAEKAGFNPLTALTQGPQGSVVQSQNYMGSAISDALLLASDATQKAKDAKLTAQDGQIAKMSKAIENMTLRPKVGGIYSQPKSGGSNDRLDSQGDVVSRPDQSADINGSTKSVEKNTFEIFSNDGQKTKVPLGPDFDEVISGFVISEINKGKARWLANNMNYPKYPPSLNVSNPALPYMFKKWSPDLNTALGRQRQTSGVMNPVWDNSLLDSEKMPFFPEKTDWPKFQLGGYAK